MFAAPSSCADRFATILVHRAYAPPNPRFAGRLEQACYQPDLFRLLAEHLIEHSIFFFPLG
jgi:hypothetical protein